MDLEALHKFTEDCIDQKVTEMTKRLQANRETISELQKLTETLENDYKNFSQKPPTAKLMKSRSPAPHSKSEFKLKSPLELKKKVSESKIPAKANEDLKKKDPEEPAVKKPEDSKKTLKKPSESMGSKIKSEKDLKKKEEAKVPKIPKPEDLKPDPKHVKNSTSKVEEAKPEVKHSRGSVSHAEDPKPKALSRPNTEPKPESRIPKKPFSKADQKPPKEENPPVEIEPKEENLQEAEVLSKPPSPTQDLINLTPVPKIYPEDSLKLILSSINPSPNSKNQIPYTPSIGIQIALHSISHIDKSKFCILTENPFPEFIWALKVIWAFQGKYEEDEKNFTEEIRNFFTRSNDKKRLDLDLGQKILNLVDCFDFSNENLDRVEKIVAGVEVNLKEFGKRCEVSGILAHLIKETVLNAGVLLPDGPEEQVYRRCLHKLEAIKTS